jgi:pSer/pThr/pTyr-binding forkhead associated (FHA) protein
MEEPPGVTGRAAVILPDGGERELTSDVTIGRLEENDVALDKPTVSRRHALISRREGRWFVEDRGSSNGTYLNGTRIQPGVPLPLRHADRIAIGDELLVFSDPAQLDDPERTEPLEEGAPEVWVPLSPFQRQVVQCLCSGWLAGASLEQLPTNDEIARRIGTPGAVETVKAALRRAYAKAGLTRTSPHTKRRDLCRLARQRGWI